MPYITQDARIEIDAGRKPLSPGELNYVITKALLRFINNETLDPQLDDIITDYVKDRIPTYTLYNEVMGVLECVYREFKRRTENIYRYHIADIINTTQANFYTYVVAPHEDLKMKENGDVF